MDSYIIDILKTGLAVVVAMMTVLWLLNVKTRNAGWVDFGWVLGFVLLSVLYSVSGHGDPRRKFLIAALVTLWGVRLGGMLLRRLLTQEEDQRYQKLREAFKPQDDLKFFFFFQFQALLDVVLSIPILLIAFNAHEDFAVIEIIGAVVWLIGFAGEALADWQLKIFRQSPANHGKVCAVGLWNYSRHPNYFFEWLMWVGYFLIALDASWGWLAVIAPLLMLHFLLNVSGVPLAEQQSLRSRGELYKEYQRTTSVFVPWLKRK